MIVNGFRQSSQAVRVVVAMGLTMLALGVLSSCEQTPSPDKRVPKVDHMMPPAFHPGPALREIRRQPTIRVRLATGAKDVTVAANRGTLTIGPEDSAAPASARRQMQGPLTIRHDADGFLIVPGDRSQPMRWRLPTLAIDATETGSLVQLNGRAYPGDLVLVPLSTVHTGGNATRMDVINREPLEDYLPGVLAKELYSNWAPEAFKAQAVASRSYALYQRKERAGSHFDVNGDTRGQMYIGQTNNPRALNAVKATRGQVLAFDDHVVPAFFSADAGVRGQDANDAYPAFPEFGPLLGSDLSDLPVDSPHQQWGPVTRYEPTLAKRMAAWGRANGHPIAGLKEIDDIGISDMNAVRRPSVFTIVDADGSRYDLRAEQFRFAANYEASGLPTLPPVQKLKSSDIEIRRRPASKAIAFYGRGFGHGIGLSQWHAQKMAQDGWTYQQILTTFYPGAKLVELY